MAGTEPRIVRTCTGDQWRLSVWLCEGTREEIEAFDDNNEALIEAICEAIMEYAR